MITIQPNTEVMVRKGKGNWEDYTTKELVCYHNTRPLPSLAEYLYFDHKGFEVRVHRDDTANHELYHITTCKLSIWVKVIRGIITCASPKGRMFIDHPFYQLQDWMKKQADYEENKIW